MAILLLIILSYNWKKNSFMAKAKSYVKYGTGLRSNTHIFWHKGKRTLPATANNHRENFEIMLKARYAKTL